MNYFWLTERTFTETFSNHLLQKQNVDLWSLRQVPGTTWVSEIYDLIYNNRDVEKCKWDAIHKQVPFTELIIPSLTYGIEQLKNIQSPQLVKTHLPVQLLPFSLWKNDCKMIYVAQNAKDVAVSYYYFYQMAKMHPEPDTWEEFLDKLIAGKVCFGSWYEHVKGWWEKMKDYRISGDRNQFTVAQYERFKEDYEKKMKGPTLKFRSEI